MKPRGLSHADVETFYDAFGARQDSAGYYEDVTLVELTRFAKFELGLRLRSSVAARGALRQRCCA